MNFPKKTGGHFLSKVYWLLAFFSFSFNQFLSKIFLEKVCSPGKVGNRDYTLSRGIRGVRMKIHKTPLLFGVSDKPSQSTYDNMLEAV